MLVTPGIHQADNRDERLAAPFIARWEFYGTMDPFRHAVYQIGFPLRNHDVLG